MSGIYKDFCPYINPKSGNCQDYKCICFKESNEEKSNEEKGCKCQEENVQKSFQKG